MSPKKQAVSAEDARAEWLAIVDGLLTQIEHWAKEEKWLVHRENKEVQEDALGSYETAVLTIQSPQGSRFIVEPIAQSVLGAEGRVDLYSWPSLNRVRLLRKDGNWIVRTDSGVDWPNPWSRQTFFELARGFAVTA